MQLNGASILIECLLEQGVDTVFGYPGGSVLFIYDALYKYSDKINHILSAHEQGAAHAADGYARSTGKTGVVIATSGPGATNLVTGIATAYMDSVPMVAITGNVPLNLLGLDSFQEVDITGITMPITKHNYIVKDISKLAETVREAFLIANSGRPGPVLIDIPKDITATMCSYTPEVPQNPTVSCDVTEQELDQIAQIISKSDRPFIYTGGGVIISDAAEEVHKLATLCDAPVSSSLMGKGGFDNTDSSYMGLLGMHGTKTSSVAVTECDLFIGIGTRFSDRVICDIKSFAPNAEIIQIDIDPAEINKNIKVNYKLIGDVKAVLTKLLPKIKPQQHKKWIDKIYSLNRDYPLMQTSKNGGVTPEVVIKTLNKLTNNNAIITTEVGQHQMWAAQFCAVKNPRHFISSGGLGTMGYGLGAALGAQVGNPTKQVVNIAGDGSFNMNSTELVTAYKYNIPIIELLFNNNVLGMVRQWQRMFYDKRFSHTTLDRDISYLKLAEAYNIMAFQIITADDVEPVLKKALAHNGPVLIDCHIDKDINVLPMVPAGAGINDPILEIEIDD